MNQTTNDNYEYEVEITLHDDGYIGRFTVTVETFGENLFSDVIDYALSALSDVGDELGDDGECGWVLQRINPPCDRKTLTYDWQNAPDGQHIEDWLSENYLVGVRIVSITDA